MALDLDKYYEDVTRIVLSEYGSKTTDPEDLVHEVCLKILSLNRGSSPYDPLKSSVSHYIHMVARGVWVKKVTRNNAEVPEAYRTHREVCCSLELENTFEKYLLSRLEFDDILPRRVFLLLKMGYTRAEICSLLDTSLYQVKKNKTLLQGLAEEFIAQ